MSMFKDMRVNGIFLFVLALQGATNVLAQEPTKTPSMQFIAQSLQYTSVFKNYQPYTEEEIIPWQQANATVEKIGGWKVYAKEASQATSEADMQHDPKAHHEGMK